MPASPCALVRIRAKLNERRQHFCLLQRTVKEAAVAAQVADQVGSARTDACIMSQHPYAMFDVAHMWGVR